MARFPVRTGLLWEALDLLVFVLCTCTSTADISINTIQLSMVSDKGSSDRCQGKDWLALSNPGSVGVSIAGYKLSDSKGLGHEDAFTFPAGSKVAGGGTLVMCHGAQGSFVFGIGGADVVTLHSPAKDVLDATQLGDSGGFDRVWTRGAAGVWGYVVHTTTTHLLNTWTPPGHNFELSGAHNMNGTLWFVTDNAELLSLTDDVWKVLPLDDLKQLCKQHGCAFESVTAIGSSPEHLYVTNEGDGTNAGAHMFKLKLQRDVRGGGIVRATVVDSCALVGVAVSEDQGVEALAYNPVPGHFYVGTRANDNVYRVEADTHGDALNGCKRVKNSGAITFKSHFVSLASLSFAPAGNTLFVFFQDTKPSPVLVARSISLPSAHPDVCFQVPEDRQLSGANNIEGITLVDVFDHDSLTRTLVVDAAHDGAPFTVERLRLGRVDCDTLLPVTDPVQLSMVSDKGSSDRCQGKDWLALSNPGSVGVSIAGYKLSDSKGLGHEDAFTFPAGSKVAGGGTLVMCHGAQGSFVFGIGGADVVTLHSPAKDVLDATQLGDSGGFDRVWTRGAAGVWGYVVHTITTTTATTTSITTTTTTTTTTALIVALMNATAATAECNCATKRRGRRQWGRAV